MSLADRLTRRVEVELGGNKWRLVITYGVLLECEELTGVNMLAGLSATSSSASLTRALLWCAIKRAGSDMTQRDIGSHLTARNLLAIRLAIWDAFSASMPDPKPAKEPIGDGKPEPPMAWDESWAMARMQFKLSESEWLDMTPRQLDALRVVDTKRMQREELLFANLTAHVVNFSARAPDRSVSAEKFMLHPFEKDPEEDKPLTGEDVQAVFAMFRKK